VQVVKPQKPVYEGLSKFKWLLSPKYLMVNLKP